MHELGIVFHIIKEVKKVAGENGCGHVSKVVMNVGEVSTVVPYYLEDCWKWAVEKEEMLKGCALEVCTVEAVTHCDSCGADYPTVAHGKICPECGSSQTWLLKGNEVEIKEIEAK